MTKIVKWSMYVLSLSLLTLAPAGGRAEAQGRKHGHESPHGGIVVTIGGYHAELVTTRAEQDSVRLDLYVLTIAESNAQPIAATELKAVLRLDGVDGYPTVMLTANPLKGEQDGTASRFSGTTDVMKTAASGQVTVRVPIEGASHRAVFKGTFGSAPAHGDAHAEEPDAHHAESHPDEDGTTEEAHGEAESERGH